jgi:hypothetical protein
VAAGVSAAELLAQDGGRGSGTALLGLLVVVLLGIATVLLIRNMAGRLRRLPERFPEQEDDDGETAPPRG